MVHLAFLGAALAAVAGSTGAFVAGHQAIENDLKARHDATVTVTVTATTCPQPLTIGYPPATVPVATPSTNEITTSPTGPGGYGNPPVTLTTPTTTAIVPHTDTTPATSSTSVETFTTASSVSTIETSSIISSTTVETTSTVASTTVASSTHTIVTPTLPPAVGGAVKIDINMGLMVLLGVVALY